MDYKRLMIAGFAFVCSIFFWFYNFFIGRIAGFLALGFAPAEKEKSPQEIFEEKEKSPQEIFEEKEKSPQEIFEVISNTNTTVHKDFGEFYNKHDQELKKMNIKQLKVLVVYFCTRIGDDIANAFKTSGNNFDLLVVMQEERTKKDISTSLSKAPIKAITLLYSNDKILDNEDNIRAIKEASRYFHTNILNYTSEAQLCN